MGENGGGAYGFSKSGKGQIKRFPGVASGRPFRTADAGLGHCGIVLFGPPNTFMVGLVSKSGSSLNQLILVRDQVNQMEVIPP